MPRTPPPRESKGSETRPIEGRETRCHTVIDSKISTVLSVGKVGSHDSVTANQLISSLVRLPAASINTRRSISRGNGRNEEKFKTCIDRSFTFKKIAARSSCSRANNYESMRKRIPFEYKRNVCFKQRSRTTGAADFYLKYLSTVSTLTYWEYALTL